MTLTKLEVTEEHSDLGAENEETLKKTRSIRKRKHVSSDDGSNGKQMSGDDFDEENELPRLIPKPIKSLLQRNKDQNEGFGKYDEGPHHNKPNNTETKCCCKDFQNTVLEDLAFLKTHLLNLTQSSISTPSSPSREDFWMPDMLPLKNIPEVEDFEGDLIKNKELQDKVSSYLTKIGGRKTDTIVKLILKAVLTDAAASQYSWEGAKGKRIFKNLTLAKIIFETVRKNPKASDASNVDIIDHIKNWLRHASSRNKKAREIGDN